MAIIEDALPAEPSLRDRTIRKLNLRVVLFCFICFMVNYLDRANIGFAALHMNQELGLSAKAFGLGAGIFFIGYLAFEIPSNMALYRFGPRVWIARIMVSWGIVSCAMALVQGPVSFYILRFLLGVAEAGFAPGVLLYLTFWFPRKECGRAAALFMTSTVVSLMLGAPLSGWILEAGHGIMGLSGWQVMFLVEGVPAILLGVVCYFYLVNRPETDTRWLTAEERDWLVAELDREALDNDPTARHDMRAVFSDGRVWLLTAVYMFYGVAIYGVIMWLPQIVSSMGHFSPVTTGLISAIPFACAAAGLVVMARSSDRTGERKYHNMLSGAAGGLLLGLSAVVPNPVLALLVLSLGAFFLWSYLGIFWTLPSQFLAGPAAAAGIAAINGFAQLGGFTGPYLVGWVKQSTGSYATALIVLACFPVIGALLLAAFRARRD